MCLDDSLLATVCEGLRKSLTWQRLHAVHAVDLAIYDAISLAFLVV